MALIMTQSTGAESDRIYPVGGRMVPASSFRPVHQIYSGKEVHSHDIASKGVDLEGGEVLVRVPLIGGGMGHFHAVQAADGCVVVPHEDYHVPWGGISNLNPLYED